MGLVCLKKTRGMWGSPPLPLGFKIWVLKTSSFIFIKSVSCFLWSKATYKCYLRCMWLVRVALYIQNPFSVRCVFFVSPRTGEGILEHWTLFLSYCVLNEPTALLWIDVGFYLYEFTLYCAFYCWISYCESFKVTLALFIVKLRNCCNCVE